MGDAPYTDHEKDVLMPRDIRQLPKDAEFLVHVGDLQYMYETECEEYAYIDAAGILKKSDAPVFVLPGDNDYNDCPDHTQAGRYWDRHFKDFDKKHWNHSFDLTRWGDSGANFSFLQSRVLFIGLNIVGGSPYERSEWKERHAENLKRSKAVMDDREDEYDIVVLFMHAEPHDIHDDFFQGKKGMIQYVKKMGKPFVNFHGDWHEWYEVDGYEGVDNYLKISLDAGEFAPPIKVEIDTSANRPVRVSRRSSDLEVECCKNGWPRDYGTSSED